VTGTQPSLAFEVLGTGRTLHLDRFQAVVAGYTGRDEEAVRHHIEELAAIGVPEPPQVPMFYGIDASTVTTAGTVEVTAGNTSGEAEPVLVRCGGSWFLGVGSDHTDRDLETKDIGESKRACPKPVAPQLVAVADWAAFDWDAVRMSSRVDGAAYQDGRLQGLRPPAELLGLLAERGADEGRDLVCFAGTLPLLTGEFLAGTNWELDLVLPDGRTISHTYEARKV
jgi:4-hydroxyphenylacetate 3-monooxygenase